MDIKHFQLSERIIKDIYVLKTIWIKDVLYLKDMQDSLPQLQQQNTSSFLHKKIEKLTAAIYIVTNLISDIEPIKWKLRETVLCLLSTVIKVKDSFKPAHFEMFVSVLEVARYAGMVSEMNYSVIKKEIEKMIDYLNTQEGDKGGPLPQGTLSDSFFSHGEYVSPKRDTMNNRDGAPINNKNEKKFKTNRQEVILEMLNKQANLGIKDFGRSIKGCSEKTIQRELLALVKKGVLTKKGERRWSTYSRV